MKKLPRLLSLSLCAVLLFPASPAAAAPGGLDLTFSGDGKHVANFGGKDGGHAVVQQPDGKLVVVGKSASQVLVARYTVAGALDTTFGTGGVVKTMVDTTLGTTAAAFAVKCLPGGKLLVGGRTGSMVSRDFVVIRYHANGSLDTTFGGGDGIAIADFGGDDFFNDMDVAPVSGKILLAGSTDVGGDYDFAIACFNADGTPDNDFDADGELVKDFAGLDLGDAARCVAALPGGDFILAGYTGNGTDNDFALLRYNADGTPDTGFGGMSAGWEQVEMGGDDAIGTMCLDPNGMLVLAGSSTVSSVYHVAIARLDPADGGLDTTFSTDGKLVDDSLGSGSDAYAVAAQPGGEIVVAGIVASDAYMLFRYLNNGTLDAGFGTNGKVTETFGLVPPNDGAEIWDVLVQGNGQILTVGTAYKAGDLDDVALARFQGTTLPDIAVEQPMPTLLEDAFSTVAYGGPLPATVPVTKTFTIRNTGLAPLNLNATPVTVTGTNAADFVVTQPLSTPLAPGLTRTFTVKLAPLTSGLKTAAIHVASNDPDENTFDITLTANVASFPVSFERPSYAVVEGNPVDVNVARAGAGSPTTVDIKSTDATAKVVNSDYTAIPTPTTVNFADGDATKTVTIPTTLNAAVEPTETFTVTLSGGTAPKGTPLTATVRIIDAGLLSNNVNDPGSDPTPPTVPTISVPAQNAVVVPSALAPTAVTVSGMAADGRAVREVEASLDNFGAVTTAVLADPGATSTAFKVTLNPTGPQPYKVKVRSFDYSPSAATVSAERTFRVARPLPVTIQGTGTVTAGFAPTSFRETEKFLTITATPGAGQVFDGWETSGTSTELVTGVDFTQPAGYAALGVTADSLELAKLTFKMQAGLQLKAKFIPNPFVQSAGLFSGLVSSDDATPAPKTTESNSTEGFYTAKVETTGAFSGKLHIDGFELNVAGAFDNTGVARFGTMRTTTVKVARTGKPYLEVALSLTGMNDLVNDNDRIEGTVKQYNRVTLVAQSNVVAFRNFHTATNTVPAGYLAASPVNGDQAYSVIMQARSPGNQILVPGITFAEYPQSYGYAAMKLTKAGAVTFTGRLADDTPFTYSGILTRDGSDLVLPFFMSLYGKAGCITGPMELINPGDPDLTYSDDTNRLLWFRPYLDVQHYQYGWPEGLITSVAGTKYVVPAAGPNASVLPDIVDPARTATASFTTGLLTGTVTEQVKLSATDVPSDFPAVDPVFSMTLVRATGVIGGNFLHSDGSTRPYYGIIYQKGAAPANRGGFGYFMSKTPAVKTYEGESGTMVLKADPP